ncbi:hypothetical protein GLA29479_2829 [Lysobacter antibioticus]|uniref:Uncharacterized protein n=1 Tax=Lysobacter antibioticus TaxID=84531 RepID=A0A0S2DZ57_LYSAN|nr:hypothetical protein [Lysobacter antibioticus]ALN63692.1 hypothetical protein GLA29479_2829 [Lysobacter antibioticus]ALN80437.1 hypothetical protein LA76x_2304 [Lysobacter antibioticus]
MRKKTTAVLTLAAMLTGFASSAFASDGGIGLCQRVNEILVIITLPCG